MDANLDKIALDLYGKIQTRFPSINIGDENANVLSKKEDIPNARFFEFEYTEDDEPLGTVAITLDSDDGIVIQISGDLANSGNSNAYKFIRSFRQFAKDRLLNFDVQNIGKSNLDKRDYQFQAKRKEMPVMVQPQQPVMESTMYGTNRISYQDLGEARLVIKHKQAVDANIPGARTMHIESIYVENNQGERFKYPFKHLNGARALAEHIKHGGTPYDSIGKHITNLSEELAQLRKFKGYVTRNEAISEAMGTVTSKVMERIEQVKKEIMHLQRPAYYESFAESFEEKTAEEIPEDVIENLVDRLTIRTFNEELKAVFPYIVGMLGEGDIPVRELGVDDILGETGEEEEEKEENTVKEGAFNPEDDYEMFIDSIVNEGDLLFSNKPNARNKAINDFNKLLASNLSGGDAGVLSLKGIIDDPELINKVQVLDSDEDIRQEIKDYILDKDPKLVDLLPNLDAQPAEIGGADVDTSELPAEPQNELPAEPQAEPQAGAVAETANLSKLKAKFIKAKECGAKLDTKIDFGDREISLQDALKECGINPSDIGFEPAVNGLEDMLKFISGFYNREKGNFPLGGQRVKIKVKKAFEDGMFGDASEDDLVKVIKFIEKKDPSGNEHNQIVRLAGVKTPDVSIGEDNLTDLENQFKNIKLNVGGQDLTPSDPDFQQKMLGFIGSAMGQATQGQLPDKTIQVPGGQMNPAQMMQQLLGKIPK